MPIKAAAKEVRADPVQVEIRGWDSITDSSLVPFMKDGMLDEFAFCLAHKSTYPLYYVLFRMCSAHMAHEANAESVFSVAGMLTRHSNYPAGLQELLRINHNRSAYESRCHLTKI